MCLIWAHLHKPRRENNQHPQLPPPFQLQAPDGRDGDHEEIDVAQHIKEPRRKADIRGLAALGGQEGFEVRLSLGRGADDGKNDGHGAIEEGGADDAGPRRGISASGDGRICAGTVERESA